MSSATDQASAPRYGTSLPALQGGLLWNSEAHAVVRYCERPGSLFLDPQLHPSGSVSTCDGSPGVRPLYNLHRLSLLETFQQLQHALWALCSNMYEVCQSDLLSDAPAAAGD